jgi:hypothetical protein
MFARFAEDPDRTIFPSLAVGTAVVLAIVLLTIFLLIWGRANR